MLKVMLLLIGGILSCIAFSNEKISQGTKTICYIADVVCIILAILFCVMS